MITHQQDTIKKYHNFYAVTLIFTLNNSQFGKIFKHFMRKTSWKLYLRYLLSLPQIAKYL
jgi:hypothetical protein